MQKPLSSKQRHVLDNLERVGPRAYKLSIRYPMTRHELDGEDCTGQITSLIIRKVIELHRDGCLARVNVSSLNDDKP